MSEKIRCQIAQASIDENGKIAGGKAGNQNGRELNIRDWYGYPWDAVIRLEDEPTAKRLARKMKNACLNTNIGYDQSNRLSFYYALHAAGYKCKKIDKPCECDRSSLVAACLIASGVPVYPSLTTYNLELELARTGENYFLYTHPLWVNRPEGLRRGDILLNRKHHVAVVVKDGENAKWLDK